MSFIRFEELLQKYFDHFTVVPKIAFVDVDISALNEFLMRDRPGECASQNPRFHDVMPYIFHRSGKKSESYWTQPWTAVPRRGVFAEGNFRGQAGEWRAQGFTDNLHRDKGQAGLRHAGRRPRRAKVPLLLFSGERNEL
jgi:hypothetical protein